MLDLKILTGCIDKISVLIIPPQISGPVDPLRKPVVKGILDKDLSSPFGILIISEGERRSADTDLSLGILLRDLPVIFIR